MRFATGDGDPAKRRPSAILALSLGPVAPVALSVTQIPERRDVPEGFSVRLRRRRLGNHQMEGPVGQALLRRRRQTPANFREEVKGECSEAKLFFIRFIEIP